MDQIVALSTSPRQSFPVSLTVNGNPLSLNLLVAYNEMAKYWVMSISDQDENPMLTNIPLLTGEYPAANILNQYQYMRIGSAYVLCVGSIVDSDYPNDKELGEQFILMWSDNV